MSPRLPSRTPRSTFDRSSDRPDEGRDASASRPSRFLNPERPARPTPRRAPPASRPAAAPPGAARHPSPHNARPAPPAPRDLAPFGSPSPRYSDVAAEPRRRARRESPAPASCARPARRPPRLPSRQPPARSPDASGPPSRAPDPRSRRESHRSAAERLLPQRKGEGYRASRARRRTRGDVVGRVREEPRVPLRACRRGRTARVHADGAEPAPRRRARLGTSSPARPNAGAEHPESPSSEGRGSRALSGGVG